MFLRLVGILLIVFVALAVLSISFLRAASPNFVFGSPKPEPKTVQINEKKIEIAYYLPYPGKILPDSPLWPLKAARDKLWLFITSDPSKKAELKILLSDKRLIFAKILFEKDKPELAFTTLTKGEKYLEEAWAEIKKNKEKGIDPVGICLTVANASLKHRQVIEEEILVLAPEDARPEIVKTLDYAKTIYKEARDMLLSKGVEPPENPFDTD